MAFKSKFHLQFWGMGAVFVALLLIAFYSLFRSSPGTPRRAALPELAIAVSGSLVGEGTLGAVLFPLFESRCHCKVRILSSGDGGSLLARLQIDARRGQFPVQVVLGVDHYLWSRAKPYLEDWHGWEPHGYHRIDPQYRVEAGFLPYDYGLMTFVVDRQAAKASGVGIPSSLRDLVGSEWMRNILLEDPRTSTPGLAFLLYSRVVFGSEVGAFWEKLQSRWLTLAPNWTSAYGLFLKGEAPIVWSYMTSQAYHESQGQASRYQALVLREGQPMQIEGAALVRGAFENDPEQDPPEVRRRLAHEFLEFLITPEAQALIPHTTWMMPVLSEVELPADFKHLPQVTRKILPEAGSQVIEVALDEWRKSVENSQ